MKRRTLPSWWILAGHFRWSRDGHIARFSLQKLHPHKMRARSFHIFQRHYYFDSLPGAGFASSSSCSRPVVFAIESRFFLLLLRRPRGHHHNNRLEWRRRGLSSVWRPLDELRQTYIIAVVERGGTGRDQYEGGEPRNGGAVHGKYAALKFWAFVMNVILVWRALAVNSADDDDGCAAANTTPHTAPKHGSPDQATPECKQRPASQGMRPSNLD